MKRTLLLAGTMALLGVTSVSWGEKKDHKVDWCHYPPGQWTGDPASSKVIVLSIDESAIPGHLNHPGDGEFINGSCGTGE